MKKKLFIILFTIFLNFVGVGILVPILPSMFGDPGSQFYILNESISPNTSYLLLGILSGIYPIMQFFAGPFLGQLSDKYGRKKILVISLLGTFLSYLLFAYGLHSKNLPLIFFSRAIDGITGGNTSVALASISDTTAEDKRSQVYSYVGAAMALGYIFGPLLGGVFSSQSTVSWFNSTTPFILVSILSFINSIFVIFSFSETLKKSSEIKIDALSTIKSIRNAFLNHDLKIVFITTFIIISGFSGFASLFGIAMGQQFQYDNNSLGYVFTILAIISVLTNILLVGFLTKKYGERKTFIYSVFLGGVAIMFLVIANQPTIYILIIVIIAASASISQAILPSLVSKSSDEREQGLNMGVSTSMNSLAESTTVFFGLLATLSTVRFSILVSGVVMILGGVYYMVLKRDAKNVSIKSPQKI